MDNQNNEFAKAQKENYVKKENSKKSKENFNNKNDQPNRGKNNKLRKVEKSIVGQKKTQKNKFSKEKQPGRTQFNSASLTKSVCRRSTSLNENSYVSKSIIKNNNEKLRCHDRSYIKNNNGQATVISNHITNNSLQKYKSNKNLETCNNIYVTPKKQKSKSSDSISKNRNTNWKNTVNQAGPVSYLKQSLSDAAITHTSPVIVKYKSNQSEYINVEAEQKRVEKGEIRNEELVNILNEISPKYNISFPAYNETFSEAKAYELVKQSGVKLLVRGDFLGGLNCIFPQLHLIPSAGNPRIPVLDPNFSLFSDTPERMKFSYIETMRNSENLFENVEIHNGSHKNRPSNEINAFNGTQRNIAEKNVKPLKINNSFTTICKIANNQITEPTCNNVTSNSTSTDQTNPNSCNNREFFELHKSRYFSNSDNSFDNNFNQNVSMPIGYEFKASKEKSLSEIAGALAHHEINTPPFRCTESVETAAISQNVHSSDGFTNTKFQHFPNWKNFSYNNSKGLNLPILPSAMLESLNKNDYIPIESSATAIFGLDDLPSQDKNQFCEQLSFQVQSNNNTATSSIPHAFNNYATQNGHMEDYAFQNFDNKIQKPTTVKSANYADFQRTVRRSAEEIPIEPDNKHQDSLLHQDSQLFDIEANKSTVGNTMPNTWQMPNNSSVSSQSNTTGNFFNFLQTQQANINLQTTLNLLMSKNRTSDFNSILNSFILNNQLLAQISAVQNGKLNQANVSFLTNNANPSYMNVMTQNILSQIASMQNQKYQTVSSNPPSPTIENNVFAQFVKTLNLEPIANGMTVPNGAAMGGISPSSNSYYYARADQINTCDPQNYDLRRFAQAQPTFSQPIYFSSPHDGRQHNIISVSDLEKQALEQYRQSDDSTNSHFEALEKEAIEQYSNFFK